MTKDEFKRKVEEHFDLIPNYFFNTFQKKIDEKYLDSQKELVSKWFETSFVKTSKDKNFNNFVFVDWIIQLLKEKEGLVIDSKAIKSVAFEKGFAKGTFYFKGLGYENGIFMKTKDKYVEDFFMSRRSFEKMKRNG